jgi:hypothetical protein
MNKTIDDALLAYNKFLSFFKHGEDFSSSHSGEREIYVKRIDDYEEAFFKFMGEMAGVDDILRNATFLTSPENKNIADRIGSMRDDFNTYREHPKLIANDYTNLQKKIQSTQLCANVVVAAKKLFKYK